MSFEIDVERRDGCTMLHVRGAGDGPALLGALAAELERSAAAGDTRLLVDLTRADAGGPSRNQIVDFEVGAARREARRGQGARTAIVVADDLHFGLARMFQTLRSDGPVDYGVFRDMGEAQRWLREPSDDAAGEAQGTA